jgi:hypothetical protein
MGTLDIFLKLLDIFLKRGKTFLKGLVVDSVPWGGLLPEIAPWAFGFHLFFSFRLQECWIAAGCSNLRIDRRRDLPLEVLRCSDDGLEPGNAAKTLDVDGLAETVFVEMEFQILTEDDQLVFVLGFRKQGQQERAPL